MYTEKPRDIRTEKKGNLSPKVMEILKVRGKLSRNMWNKYKIQFWSDNIFGWNCRQPPCGAVSWNEYSLEASLYDHGQPPCGAVSWNMQCLRQQICRTMSAPLWGCELKFFQQLEVWRDHGQPPCGAVSWNTSNGSSRPMEDGQPPCGAVSWNCCAMTFSAACGCQPPCGAVSWNNRQKTHPRQRYCQPPCGAVSLNTDAGTYLVYVKAVSPLAGLWVEM